jgi:hypothetical protein
LDHIHIANNIKELKKKGWVKLSKRRDYGGDELSVSKKVIDVSLLILNIFFFLLKILKI